MRLFAIAVFALFTLVLLPVQAPAQDVFKAITDKHLEEILKSLNIDFAKFDGGKGVSLYEFKAKTVPLRLLSFEGKDLRIECYLQRTDLETIKKYNNATKFSRARLTKMKNGSDGTVVESSLDLRGGVTDGTIKHFIGAFEEELAVWAKTAVPVVTEEMTFKNVPPAKLEKILKELNINFKKESPEPGVVVFLYTRHGQSIRLSSFGGEDLMIDRHWVGAKTELAKLNEWNANRVFVRAVAHPANKSRPATVALEANLDCTAGVSESIVRNFINAFDDEVRRFDEYLKKQ
jgi:hypothetical protein